MPHPLSQVLVFLLNFYPSERRNHCGGFRDAHALPHGHQLALPHRATQPAGRRRNFQKHRGRRPAATGSRRAARPVSLRHSDFQRRPRPHRRRFDARSRSRSPRPKFASRSRNPGASGATLRRARLEDGSQQFQASRRSRRRHRPCESQWHRTRTIPERRVRRPRTHHRAAARSSPRTEGSCSNAKFATACAPKFLRLRWPLAL